MTIFDRIANTFGLDAFDRKHKYAFVLLAVAIIGVIVLWTVELRRNIIEPLYVTTPKNVANGVQSPVTTTTQDEVALRSKDTDGDALSDYDEFNLYKTSPYLADSDSDGFSDKQEIDSANDPNCPKGKVCGTTSVESGTASDFSNPQLDSLLNGATTLTTAPSIPTMTTAPATSLTEEQKATLRAAVGDANDPKLVRDFMKQAGLPQSTLDSLTDAQVVATFNEMVR